jgi:hypothetical protein
MWPLCILLAFASLAGYFSLADAVRDPVAAQAQQADLAANMATYRAALVRYLAAHPTFSGVVPDANLQFPSWYVRYPWWRNDVSDGTIVVYADGAVPANFTSEVVRLSNNSMLAGAANGATHRLYSPVFGDTGIGLPAVVPDRATVWLARIN